MSISVKFWGTRGSIPTGFTDEDLRAAVRRELIKAGPQHVGSEAAADRFLRETWPDSATRRFGGETTCVEVGNDGGGSVLIDLGSGARDAGLSYLSKGSSGKQKPINILLTHLHWDHIQGFPFFVPAYQKGRDIRIFSCHPIDVVKQSLAQQLSQPNFPLSFKDLAADISFFNVNESRKCEIGGFTVEPFKLTHNGDSYGFKLKHGGKSVVFASDAEHDPYNVSKDNPYVHWIKRAELLIFDAQYSLEDACISKEGWGHSSDLVGVELAQLAQVKRMAMTHHDPSSTDQQILSTEARAQRYQHLRTSLNFSKVDVFAARDGQCLTL